MNDENAFPQVVTMPKHTQLLRECYSDVFSVGGLTKREYFAAAALTGLLARADTMGSVRSNAALAIEYADLAIVMLEAGRKP